MALSKQAIASASKGPSNFTQPTSGRDIHEQPAVEEHRFHKANVRIHHLIRRETGLGCMNCMNTLGSTSRFTPTQGRYYS
jgi:hypothetical protein